MAERHWSAVLRDAGACGAAILFAREYPTFQAAWDACPRADWMLWWLGRTLSDTQEHREALTCIAIRIVLAIPKRMPIAGWDEWAAAYLAGTNRTDKAAAGAAWAAARAAAAGAEAAARAAEIVRAAYPTPPLKEVSVA